MDKAKKIKVFTDILMAALFLLAMNTAVTGVLLHEVLGVTVAVLFSVHLVLNRQWIASITRNFWKSVKPKVKAAYIFNIIIAVTTGMSILSGLFISQFLFPWLAAGDIGLWHDVHVVSSWLALLLLIVHTVLHWRWIRGVVRQFAKQTARLKVLVSRTVVGLIASATIYSLIANDSLYRLLSPSVQNNTGTQIRQSEVTDSTVLVPSETSGSAGVNDAAVTAAPAAIDQVTLEEFLGKLYCTACHRHCPLTNPQCSKGARQAEEQTAVYYAQYGQN
ncbi:MAG: cytochrome b/b6 domain-containing protein [Bacillota bacterium]